VRADKEAAQELASQAAPAAVPTTEAASRHTGAATVTGRDSAKAAPLVAPVQLATKQRPLPQRPPPQQLTQRRPPPAGVAASTARLPPPRIVAAAAAAGQKRPVPKLTQLHHASPCGCVAPVLTFICMERSGTHGRERHRQPDRERQPSHPMNNLVAAVLRAAVSTNGQRFGTILRPRQQVPKDSQPASAAAASSSNKLPAVLSTARAAAQSSSRAVATTATASFHRTDIAPAAAHGTSCCARTIADSWCVSHT